MSAFPRTDHDQYELGYEGVQLLAKFLESRTGILTVSVNESQYSAGNMFFPDCVFLNYGLEVKRSQFLTRSNFKRGQQFRAALSAIHINNCGWHYLKEYCSNNGKLLRLVTVLTWANQEPIFIGLSEPQVDKYISDFEERNPQSRPQEFEGKLVYKVYIRKQGPFAGHKTEGSFVSVNMFELLRVGTILNHPENFRRFFKDLPSEYLFGLPQMNDTTKAT
jgi:hypothetical protein